jgi:hypothetical protein
MAKMIVNYAVNALGIIPPSLRDTSLAVLQEGKNTCIFSDISDETAELQQYIILACQLGLTGIHPDGTVLSDFMPNKTVSRAEFGTVLSRLLYGAMYNEGTPYYINHLQALKNN